MHRHRRLLEQPGTQLLVAIVAQPGQRFFDALSGAAECRRLLGEDFMAERVEGGFGGRGIGQTGRRTQGRFSLLFAKIIRCVTNSSPATGAKPSRS